MAHFSNPLYFLVLFNLKSLQCVCSCPPVQLLQRPLDLRCNVFLKKEDCNNTAVNRSKRVWWSNMAECTGWWLSGADGAVTEAAERQRCQINYTPWLHLWPPFMQISLKMATVPRGLYASDLPNWTVPRV